MMVAGTACDDDPVYAVPEKNSAKILSIKQQMPPHLLSNGSLVAITYDTDVQMYVINRISKDGTVTSTILPCHLNTGPNGYNHWLNIRSNDANDIIVDDYGEYSYKCVCKIDQSGTVVYYYYLDQYSNYKPLSGAPLPDGRYALLGDYIDNGYYYRTIDIFDNDGLVTDGIETKLFSDDETKNICSFALGNNIIMIKNDVSQPMARFCIVSSEDGSTLVPPQALMYEYYAQNSTYSTYEFYSFKDHLYISEPNYNTRKTKVTRLNEQGKKDFSVILDMYHLYGVSEIDGKAIFAGINLPKDCERYVYSPSDVGIYMRPYLQDIKGCIVTMDASDGCNAETIDISYEGGILPYGVASDDNGGYYVYMTRIMPSEVNDVEWLFHDNIHIYHTDNLNKLQIER